MSALFKLSNLLATGLAAAGLAGAASAQAADWNRSIKDIRIVHPPGTPPGIWRVECDVEFGASDIMPAGLDLGMEIQLSLNGTVIQATTLGVSSLGPIQCYAAAQCTIGAACTDYNLSTGLHAPGWCDSRLETYNGYTAMNCKCYAWFRWIAVDTPFFATDILTLSLVPAPGSVPELITTDDALSRTVGENVPGEPYCFGDGSLATACPCANNGLPGNGCANSVHPAGANLASTGFVETDPLTGTDNVVLHGSGMPDTATAIYLKGSGSNPSGAVFGDGVRCVAGSLIRLRTKINVGGASRFPEPGDPSLSVRGATPYGSGLSAWYQVYYRNPASWCTAATFNISNGLRIDW